MTLLERHKLDSVSALVGGIVAAVVTTMWGCPDGWQDSVVALARISVVWTIAAFGAALGDILLGESSGEDIEDDLATLGGLSDSDGEPDRE